MEPKIIIKPAPPSTDTFEEGSPGIPHELMEQNESEEENADSGI